MKPALFGTILGLAVLAAPAASFAATYQYVNTSGMLESVTADSADQALMAPDIAAHSGVILLADVSTASSTSMTTTTVTTATSTPTSYSITTTPATTTVATSTSTTSTSTQR